jgi:hypothetical protein
MEKLITNYFKFLVIILIIFFYCFLKFKNIYYSRWWRLPAANYGNQIER